MNVITAIKHGDKVTVQLMDFEEAIRSDPYMILIHIDQWNRLKKKQMIDTNLMTTYPDKFLNKICNVCYRDEPYRLANTRKDRT